MISASLLRNILWLLATLEIAISLYVLVLNYRNSLNRQISGLMLIFSINTLGLGLLVSAGNLQEAYAPMVLQASTNLAVIAAILVLVIAFLYPEPKPWLRIVRYLVQGFTVLPGVLTLIDALAGTSLWLSDPGAAYTGGYVQAGLYNSGVVANVLRVPLTYSLGLLTVLPPLWAAFEEKNTPTRRRLAFTLLGTQIATIIIQVGLRNILVGAISSTLVNVVFALGYGYITFDLLFRYRSMQSGALRTRLTLLALVVTIPVLFLVGFVTAQTGRELLIANSQNTLQDTNATLKSNVSVWVDQNVRALQHLELQPEIRSMDPDLQKPALERMTRIYPYMYLVSTTDLEGVNIARNDAEEPKLYSDRVWFQNAVSGAPVTYQTLIGRTSGEPAFVVSVPIRGQNLRTEGVLMFAATLDDLRAAVESTQARESGLEYYIVNELGDIILSSAQNVDRELVPLETFYASGAGSVRYEDANGISWLSYTDSLPNGWVVITEQEEQTLLDPAQTLQRTNVFNIIVSIVLITVLIYATVRQALRPINTLSDTASAIIAGDLEKRAPIESDDELGSLAGSFNTMADRLGELIAGLEGRVQNRTAALEQRSRFLQASAEVARAATTILDTQELFTQVVELIRENFGLYYVGLFQVDVAREWAVLRAGTGEAGQAMLARDHRILVGTGMVGWSINNNQVRLSSRVAEDAVRLASSELPDTRAEAALPLTSRGVVLGALSVQSTEPDFFDDDTLTTLQAMADQIAVAIDNATLYTTLQTSLETERRAFGLMLSDSVQGVSASTNDWVYTRSTQRFDRPDNAWHPAMVQARQNAGTVLTSVGTDQHKVAVPIRVRDEIVGVLDLSRSGVDTWTRQEIALLETISEQLGAALESALLYETTRRRASREQMIRQITENISSASNVQDAIGRAMQALADVANANQVAVRIGSQDLLSIQQGDAHE